MKYVGEGLEAGCFHAPKGIKQGVETVFEILELSKSLHKKLPISTPDEIDRAVNMSSCSN